MPNGPTHDFLTVASAAVATPLVISLPQMNALNYACLIGAYVGSNYLFSNDLDLHSDSYDRWGLLRFIWYPYQKVIHHRNWVSHGLIVGPLLRIVYFACAVFLLLFGLFKLLDALGSAINPGGTLGDIGHWLYGFFADHPVQTAYFLIGFVLSGALHTIADIISTGLKRRFLANIM